MRLLLRRLADGPLTPRKLVAQLPFLSLENVRHRLAALRDASLVCEHRQHEGPDRTAHSS